MSLLVEPKSYEATIIIIISMRFLTNLIKYRNLFDLISEQAPNSRRPIQTFSLQRDCKKHIRDTKILNSSFSHLIKS